MTTLLTMKGFNKKIEYLCFTANTAGSTIRLYRKGNWEAPSFETSTDGENWSAFNLWDTITLTNVWDKIYYRNTSETPTSLYVSLQYRVTFSMTWNIAWSWDLTYLVCKNGTKDTIWQYRFSYLFQSCSSLTSAPDLPSNPNSYQSYYAMFNYCTGLTTPPKLPATSLWQDCYGNLFDWCTGLTEAPELPATTLAQSCYEYMFKDCTSITKVKNLPATTLADNCYQYMFSGCKNLTYLPELPATAVWYKSYQYMFYWCSKIKLSATQTWEYQTAYRVPKTWTWTDWGSGLKNMFANTWWTFTWTPTINTTYYTSNTVV